MVTTRDLGTPIPIIRVVVWYADGSKLSAANPEEWEQLPAEGVQLIQVLYRRLTNRKYLQDVLSGEDYYWYHAGYYYAGSAKFVPQEATHVKTGQWISDEDYFRMYNEALLGVMP